MIVNKVDMAKAKLEDMKSGQRSIEKTIIQRVKANVKKGYIVYSGSVLLEKTIVKLRGLGLTVEPNYSIYPQTEYLIRWFDNTAHFAKKMCDLYKNSQDAVVEKIERDILNCMGNGYYVYTETFLTDESIGKINALGFGVECYQPEFGKFTYVIRWYDSLEGLASQYREANVEYQEFFVEEILDIIASNVDLGVCEFGGAYLHMCAIEAFDDAGYTVVTMVSQQGAFSYKFSWV